MPKVNTMTKKGRTILKLLDRAKKSETLTKDLAAAEALICLREAVETLVMVDGPCWELEDA